MMFFLTKFLQVWSVLVFVPIIVFIFHRIKIHYELVGEQLRAKVDEPVKDIQGKGIVVPVAGITQVVDNSINYAKSVTDQG